jgi:hypothetical protein
MRIDLVSQCVFPTIEKKSPLFPPVIAQSSQHSDFCLESFAGWTEQGGADC